MYFSSVGGNYLKAQTQNNFEKARCDLQKSEIARRGIQSLATINKNIQNMKDFLKEIKASSGCYKDARATSAPCQTVIVQAAGKIKKSTRVNAKIVNSSNNSDLDRWTTNVSKREFEFNQSVPEIAEKSEQSTLSKTALVKASKGFVKEKAERDGERNLGRGDPETDEWLFRDKKLKQTVGRNASRVVKTTNKHGSDTATTQLNSNPEESQAIQKLQQSLLFLPDTQTPQDAENQHPGSQNFKRIPQTSGPQLAWSDKAPNTSDCLTSFTPGAEVTAVRRSQTAPAKASRPKAKVRSAALSERNLDFSEAATKYMSTSELKKLKIHVSMSKMERRRILQELIANCNVPADRSVLERERQRLLRDKIRQFFELLFEQTKEKESSEENFFCDD